MKKTVSIILAVLMLVSMIPLSAIAQTIEFVDNSKAAPQANLSVEGENYDYFEVNSQPYYEQPVQVQVDRNSEVTICAHYDFESYEVEEPGFWIDAGEGMLTYTFTIKTSQNVTAPTLTSKAAPSTKYTVTVEGENYYKVKVSFLGEGVTPDAFGKYAVPADSMVGIIAFFDSETYEIKEMPEGWQEQSPGEIATIYETGEEGGSGTVVLPELTEKPQSTKFAVTVQGENYSRLDIADSYDYYEGVTVGVPCEVNPNDSICIYAYYDFSLYDVKETEGWEDWGDCAAYSFTSGNAGESITITAPQLIDDPLKDYKAAAKAAIDKYYADCGMVLEELAGIVDYYKTEEIGYASSTGEIDDAVANAKADIDGVVAARTQFEDIVLTKAPVLGGENGTFSWKSFYINDDGQRVDLSSGTNEATFEDWYLRTAYQVKYDNYGAMTIRFISFLDENFESYEKAGFVVEGIKTIETTEVYEELSAEDRMVDVSLMGISDYAFVVTASFSEDDYLDQQNRVTVTPFVVKDGVTYSGDTFTEYFYNIYMQYAGQYDL